MVVRSVEEVKKKFKPISVIETEDSFWVLKDKDKGYFRVLKPRPLKQVQDILSEGLFPSRYVKLLENLTETKALSVARKIKKDLLLWGAAGTRMSTFSGKGTFPRGEVKLKYECYNTCERTT